MKQKFLHTALAVVTLLALLFGAVGVTAVHAAGGPLVASWHFDGDYSDASSNGYNGTLFPSNSYPSFSMDVPASGGSNSLQFDGGNGYGMATLGNEISGNHTFTVSFWIKYVPQAKRQWVMLLGNPSTLQGVHWLIDANGMTNFGVFDGGGNLFDFSPYANQWVKVTTVYYASASRFSTYVNGQLMSTAIANTPSLPTSTPAYVGYGPAAYITGGDMQYAGYLDEVEVKDCVDAVSVFNTNDSGTDSLRQALADVCDGGTITFDSSINGTPINLASTLSVTKNVTIRGNGAANTILQGTTNVRHFTQTAGNLTLDGMTLQNGSCAGGCPSHGSNGAAVLNWSGGTLTILNSTLKNNAGSLNGGAVGSFGTALVVRNSTFSGNTSTGGAGTGGAITANGTVDISNSTFSGNSAAFLAGTIFINGGTGSLINNTIANNTGNVAVYTPNAAYVLNNNIIANNSGGDCSAPNGVVASSNLIKNGASACGLANGVSGNIIGVDPLLNGLASNGGPTQTMSLQSGSPALGTGDAATCAAAPVNNLDQRGEVRPQGDPVCDIGAYESNLVFAHTVTFHGNGNDSGSMSPQTASSPTPLTSNGFGRTGYTFSGWDTSPAGTTVVYADGALYNFSANMDLYAVWSAIPKPAAFGKTYPQNIQTGVPTSLTLTWEASSGANAYYYCYYETGVGSCMYYWNTSTSVNISGLNPGTSYTWQVQAVNNGGLTDADGGVEWTFTTAVLDTTPPVVSSIVRAGASPTAAAAVDFTVTFSEAVTGVDETDFAVTPSGVSGAGVSGVVGSGDTYTVTVNTGTGNGTLRLDLIDDDSIQDTASLPLGGTGSGNGNFTTGQMYSIIKTATFVDVPLAHWANSYVERIAFYGITSGCSINPLAYCPDSPTTRAELAIFIERGLHGASFVPPNVAPTFNDTAGNFAEDWIEALKADGLTAGCGNGNYCPNAPVTRAEMAVLLLRSEHGAAYTPPTASGSLFTDVSASHWAAAWIEQFANEGLTSGCGGGAYCPNGLVTRAQMAVFMVRIFNLP